MFTEQEILKALSTVIDPDLKKDLVSLGMIGNLVLSGSRVEFDLVLTTPACPLKGYLTDSCIKAIHEQVSQDLHVEIRTTSKVTMRNRNSDTEWENLNGVRNIIAVVSGKGGVGKSTIAANLAAGLAQEGAKVGLIDGDIYGPSVPIMFGLEGFAPDVTEQDGRQLIHPLEAHGVKVISMGFFVSPEASLMWRGPMASNYLKQLITDTQWGELDYLIFDMPPGTGDMHLTLVQTVPVTGAVIVSTPQKVALADARKAVSMLKDLKIHVPVLGFVENMSYFSPPEYPDKKYYLFGKEGTRQLAAELELNLLGEIPLFEDICISGDTGQPAVLGDNMNIAEAFLAFCRNTAQAISIRNASASPTTKVEMKT